MLVATTEAVTVPVAVPGTPAPPRSRAPLVAAVLGLLAAALAIAFPFMPVHTNTAELTWPTAATGTDAVHAPLIALRPLSFTADVGCAALRGLDARGGGTVLATTPEAAPNGTAVGLAVTVADGTLTVADRGSELATASLVGATCDLQISSTAARTDVLLGGAVLVETAGDLRPQVVGVFSDLDDGLDDMSGTAVRIEIDNRFDSAASTLKILVGVAAVAALIGSLLALHRLDGRHARQPVRRRTRPRGRDVPRDAVVATVLVVWAVIGSLTPDDGYILTMVRSATTSGWVGNYYRWFNVPEAPFGWFYELYALWAQVSDAVLWLRIPALVIGLASWWLISRQMLPRLGVTAGRSRASGWAAAMLFLCFWLPFGNGLRPEPVVVVMALLAACGLERALATRALVPLALGLIAAAFAVAATPTGLLAAAVFLAGIRPLLRGLRARASVTGWPATVGPIAGAGLIVLVAVYADQTWATVLEATRVRTAIGPNLPWFGELYRYTLLFSTGPDGSLARRFAVLMLVVCVGIATVVLVRRGRIRGAATGPARRLIGTVAIGFAVLALTPTKWTHHFGAFAGLGATAAALAAVATGAAVLRARRNRLLAGSGFLGATALAFTGVNAWWYVSNWGIPWFDRPPVIGGIDLYEVLLLGAAVMLALAVIEHLRGPRPSTWPGSKRAVAFSGAPVAMLCGLIVLFDVASLAKGMQKQIGSYALGADVVLDPTGENCGLSSRILVETDPLAGALAPAPGPPPQLDGFAEGALPPGGPGSAEDVDGMGRFDAGVIAPGPAVGPVFSSYRSGTGNTGDLTGGWYALPPEAQRGEAPLVVGVAGELGNGTGVAIELGRSTGAGIEVLEEVDASAGAAVSASADPSGGAVRGRGWRDIRWDVSETPGADRVRVVAADRTLTRSGWVAVSGPRVPRLTPMLEVTDGRPGYLDWPVALPHPCLRTFDVRDGVAEVPAYRVLADPQQRGVGDEWSAPPAGGPLAWLTLVAKQRVVPTYLEGDWGRDWGQLRLVEPYVPGAAGPDVRSRTELRWGWSDPGPIGEPPAGVPVDVR